MRLSLASAIACALAAVAVVGQSHATADNSPNNDVGTGVRPSTTKVSIAPQALSTALQTFAEQSKLYLIYAQGDVINHRTSGATGELTAEEALQQLLKDTGLTYKMLDESTVAIVPASDKAAPGDSQSNGLRVTQTEGLASDALEEILVTAQRRSESIQDVPISITAISGEHMARANVRGIEEVFAKVPNVSVVSNGSRDRKEISIRGISNQLDPYANIRSATYAFYIDEFNVIAGTTNPEILDLERIEVLRGPQGTYFGRNSIGGAINITTRKPTNEWGGEIGLGYSSFDTKRASAIVNIPVVDGVLALRASGMIETSDGNIKNINAIGKGNNTDYKTGRLVARLTPTQALTSDTTFSYTHEANGMRAGVPTGALTTTWRNLFYGGAPGDVADPDGVGFYPNNVNRVNFNRPQEVGTEFWYVSNRTSYEFDTFEINSVVGYLSSSVGNTGDVDGGSYDYFHETTEIERTSLNGELRIQSIGTGNRIDWSMGVSAGKDKGATRQVVKFGTAGLLGRPEDFEIANVASKAVNPYQAIFAQGTLHFTDRFSATAGARYTHETVEQDSRRFSNQVLTDNIVGRSRSFSDFSPKLTLAYEPDQDVLIYVTASRGFKSGGIQTAQALLTEYYNPETLWNYEAGLKFSAFERRLRFDISGFYVDWKNVQQSIRLTYLDSGGILRNVSGIDNAAAATSYGIDTSVDFRVMPNWLVSAHMGYLKAKFDSFPNALLDGGMIRDLSGKTLVNSPRWTLGADTEYRHKFSDSVDVFGRAEWNYRSSTYSNTLAYRYETYPFIAPSYQNVNVRLGVETGRFSVIGYIENLFDENYYNNVYEKAFYSGVQVEPFVRRVGVNLSYKF